MHGLLGSLVYFALFWYWSVLILRRDFDRVMLGAWLIVFVNYLQRPAAFGGGLANFILVFLIHATVWRQSSVSSHKYIKLTATTSKTRSSKNV